MFGRVAKIPIANTFSGLVEMDFADYGDHATFLYIQDTFSRFSVIAFIGTKKLEEQTAEMVRETMISNWIAVLAHQKFYWWVKISDLLENLSRFLYRS